MHISSISISNFRLLRSVKLSLETTTTVIVGRNNSGKTSLTELFRRLLSDNSPSFRLEDFSCGVHSQFLRAYALHFAGADAVDVRNDLPFIEVSLAIDYQDHSDAFGSLSAFIVDLDATCSTATITIRFQLADGKLNQLFEGIDFNPAKPKTGNRDTFFKLMKERVPQYFHSTLEAVDPADASNRKSLEWSALSTLIQSGFINAQRWLDDTTHRDNDVLGKVLESLFRTARSEGADPKDKKVVDSLDTAIERMQLQIDTDINTNIQTLLPALSLLGYPGLNDPRLRTETTLDVQRLLVNHTKVRYEGVDGINLPEAYNGLGARNLIFILLKLLEFFKSYQSQLTAPKVHLVFIEEPEAHLHPQMAEVFIRKLEEIRVLFADIYNEGVEWPVQFVISTHSSHLANEAHFESIRYFLATSEKESNHFRQTQIKDLRFGLKGTPPEDKKFVHQYMTLTRCDLFFADKAVLIEGCTERILLPEMIKKCDKADGTLLSSQYISVVEVCGAYAHRFFDLLSFLELRTLVITDLDSAQKIQKHDKNGVERTVSKACLTEVGTHTTNACITAWFDPSIVSIQDLLQKTDDEKTKNLIRLAYEVPEQDHGPCGRSFEDAFMLANVSLFELDVTPANDLAKAAFDLASEEKKSEFALVYALEKPDWTVPRYIRTGLQWLAKPLPDATNNVSAALVAADDGTVCEA